MLRRAAVPLLALCLYGCKPPEESHSKAIIGAVLIDGAGGPPLSNSAVLVAEGRISQAGREGEFPIPGETDKINGGGRFVVPALIDVYPKSDPATAFAAPGPSSPEEARARISALASKHPDAIHIRPAGMNPEIVAALVEAGRSAGIPVAGHPANQAEAQLLVQDGAGLLIGMIHGEALDPAFVTHLRDLRVVYAPALSSIPPNDLDRARQNTARLFAAGVPLAVASGGDPTTECERLVEAGVPALDVIVAATQNGARALGLSDRGTIQAGKRADLLMLRANPGEDIRNLRQLDRKMLDGEWKR